MKYAVPNNHKTSNAHMYRLTNAIMRGVAALPKWSEKSAASTFPSVRDAVGVDIVGVDAVDVVGGVVMSSDVGG